MVSADPQTLDAYRARAEAYAAIPPAPEQDAALARFLADLPEGGRILDLGCGPGLQAAAMQAAGFDVTGLDPLPEFVAATRSRGVRARLGSFTDLTEVAAYDGIHASFSLLHAPRADMPGHLARIRTALTPGGRVFLGLKLGTGEGRDALGRFYTYYSEADLRHLLTDAGFTVTGVELGHGAGLAGTDDPFILVFAHA